MDEIEIEQKEESKKNDAKREALAFIWETARVILISLAIIIPIRFFLVQPFFVKGASMEDAFHDGDYILIDEISYRFKNPERGEVVVFRYPDDPSQFFIKRIVGLPGETIIIEGGQIKIKNDQNPEGFALDEDSYLTIGFPTLGDLKVKLDENDYFVLGDNRARSSDSRRWGPLNETLIIGKAFFKAWPLNNLGMIAEATYQINF